MSEHEQTLQVVNFQPLTVARALLESHYATENGQGLLLCNERWLRWNKVRRRWEAIGKTDLRRELWLVLDRLEGPEKETNTGSVIEQFVPTREKVKEVMEALESLCVWKKELPAWLAGEGLPRADHCVAFEDVVVDVAATAAAVKAMVRLGGAPAEVPWVTIPRGPEWLGAVLPCNFEGGAKCPVYEEKCRQWTPDPKDWELRERFYGYCLMGTRKYRRGLSEFGKAHGGKGSWTRLLEKMLGRPWFFGTQLAQLSNDFASPDLAVCSVMTVSECDDMGDRESRRCASIVKAAWGQDSITVNRKHLEQEGVKLRFAPIFQGNSMLDLPDDNGGISGKLLWVHFKESFVGKEDPQLDEKLEAEMAGIARRWVEAAVRLETAEGMGEKWCMGVGGAEVAKRYRLDANPWDAFVEACFVVDGKGFIEADMVKRVRAEWEKRVGVRLCHKDGTYVSDQDLLRCLEENTTRAIRRKKIRRRLGDVEVQRRGLGGVLPRAMMKLGEDHD